MNSGHFGRLSEHGVHLPHLAWGSFPSWVRVLPCGMVPNGSAITREKGRALEHQLPVQSDEQAQPCFPLPAPLSVPYPAAGAQASPTALLVFQLKPSTALS